MKSSKKQNANMGIKAPQDNDPEAIETFVPSGDSDSDSGSEEGVFTGREHYQSVGKSKLRKPPRPTLGKEYEGSTVSRAALNGHDDYLEDPFAHVEDNSDDDPFAKGVTDGEESNDSTRENERGRDMAIVDGQVAEDEDEEIDSDEAFGDGDVSKFLSFKFRGSKSLQSARTLNKIGHSSDATDSDDEEMGGDQNSEDVTDQGFQEDDMESGQDVEMDDKDLSSEANSSDDDSASTNSTSPTTLGAPAATSSDRAALKAILANDTAAVASALSAAADLDAKKGKAVKQQYQSFDRMLDARIKLQKGLSAVNHLADESFTESENEVAIRKAEEAAFILWSTIESIRYSLLDAQQSIIGLVDETKKRKRPAPATTEASTSDLWSRTQSLESQSLPHHRAVLDKWSSKARPVTALQGRQSQLSDHSSHNPNNITAVLDTYIATEIDKVLGQASQRSDSTTPTVSPLSYDDTPFYQSLLRDLIASRSSTSAALSNMSAIAVLPSTTTPRLHTPGSKTKRVNTKASKGRKVRYTVHEKLQNFAAEEERGTWEESARREFFGSLFGRRAMLDEDGSDEDSGAGDEERDNEVEAGEREALRLFRN